MHLLSMYAKMILRCKNFTTRELRVWRCILFIFLLQLLTIHAEIRFFFFNFSTSNQIFYKRTAREEYTHGLLKKWTIGKYPRSINPLNASIMAEPRSGCSSCRHNRVSSEEKHLSMLSTVWFRVELKLNDWFKSSLETNRKRRNATPEGGSFGA